MGRWTVVSAVIAALCAGAGLGVGSYTFIYAKGLSYMSNDPAVCANCHVMREYLDAWQKGSHHAVAVCNDCHTPHNLIGKYYTKALNGYHHSLAFTTGWFPDNIQITPRNREITQGACRHCHGEMVLEIDAFGHGPQALDCIRCHGSVGHMN
ncbi:MAG: cytochrome c nitrite reductase small subunit [Candidatus Hydrogenedens sp.]|nr:cytochrome c nitrite reductase small subunit [Candidatus Hydrogenedentota bacterium]NLF56171.1 cytochrome c nitrite reductase small subunit [Candidatus Hydrogenedens sp.]